mmetsp:Transcript_7280/g.18404  ORF Transcript_7280/g.18404 Transcript_7280/m.18404 type:complete len:380 (-) Transcript_7280:150-1289(-)
MRLLAKDAAHHALDTRRTHHTADQDHLVDVARLQASIAERLLARRHGALNQILDQGFVGGAADAHLEMHRSLRAGCDVGQVDAGLSHGAQFALGLLGGLAQTLQTERVLAEIDALVLLVLLHHVVEYGVVKVLAAQEGVPVGALHLEDTVVDLQNAHIERTTSQIVHDHGLLFVGVLVQAVGQRGGGRLVDDAAHLEAGDLTGILGGLTLRIVEVGRHRDHRLGDRVTQMLLGGLLHLGQHEGGHLGRRILFAAHLHPRVAVGGLHDLVRHHLHVLLCLGVVETTTDQALGRIQRARRVAGRLALRCHTHQTLTLGGERHHTGSGALALHVLNDTRGTALHHSHTAVSCAEIDTDDGVLCCRAGRQRALLCCQGTRLAQ